jgi:hypothetical protein
LSPHYYLSNATKAEVLIVLNELGATHYATTISFLEDCLHKWSLETSVDGKIRKATQVIVEDKIKIEFGPKGCIIYFSDVPKVREIYWSELIKHVQELLVFPNHCFLINSEIVNDILARLSIPTDIVYKALLEICAPLTVQEDVFRTLQAASSIPTQEEIQNVPNVVLMDSFNYEIQIPQQPYVPVMYPAVRVIYQSLGGLDDNDLELLETL